MITIRIDHKDPALLAVFFPGPPDRENPLGNDLIREVPGRRWSYTRRCWLVPNTRAAVVHIGKLFGRGYCRFDEAVVRLYKPTATDVEVQRATMPSWPPQSSKQVVGAPNHRKPFRYAAPLLEYDRHPVIQAVAAAIRLQNYSLKTFKNYKQALISLLRYAGLKSLDQLTKDQYKTYLLFLLNKKRLSSSTVNVHINAWKFYQEKILGRDKTYYDIELPRRSEKLPTVYSIAEVKAIFLATTSLKYRTLFRLVYSTGLRLSEVAHLRLADIDSSRNLITVKAGKGRKDRVVMLSPTLRVDFRSVPPLGWPIRRFFI